LNKVMQSFSDEELIEVYKSTYGSRRQKAFDCLYLRHTNSIRHYFFFALNRDNEKAKDFAHDLFLKILESPDKFDTNQLFKTWIYRVASNMCKNEYRKQEVVSKFNNNIRETRIYYTSLNENEIKLSESIKRLPQEQRSLIVLRFKINLSIKEIAEVYQCPEGTIKSRLFYATKELSKYYKE